MNEEFKNAVLNVIEQVQVIKKYNPLAADTIINILDLMTIRMEHDAQYMMVGFNDMREQPQISDDIINEIELIANEIQEQLKG